MKGLPCMLFFLLVFSWASAGQPTLLLGANMDMIRSDHNGFFGRAQGGFEANYFFSRKFAVTGGLEVWTARGVIPVVGVRLCPVDEAFVRLRALPGRDFSIGGGFARPLKNKFRIEAMADFYLAGDIAIRAGLAYTLAGRKS